MLQDERRMPRRAGEAMQEIVLTAFAILLGLHLDLQSGAVAEAADQQPLDLDDEVVRLIRIEPEPRELRGNAHSDVGADRRHGCSEC